MIAIIFDTETTGLLLPSSAPLEKQPRIIELGAIKVNERGVLEELSQLIDPQEAISAQITKITGIQQQQLVGKPTFAQFLPQLAAFFKDATVLVAHNAPFDSGMLRTELERSGCEDFPWPREIICTVQEYLPLFGRRAKLTELYERITGNPLAQTHRALDDARAVYDLLACDKFFEKAGLL